MYKSLLKQLRNSTDAWCISIVLPTEKGFHDHKMTDAAIKTAFREAESALEEKGLDKKEVQHLMDRLHETAKDVDFAHSQEGVGFFVNHAQAHYVDFPFPVERKVVVDSSFEVRDLVYGAGALDEYYFLNLSRGDCSLYYSIGRKMWDLAKHNQGLEDLYVDLGWKFEKGHGDNDLYLNYLMHVDKNLGHYLNKRKLPVVVNGPDEAVNYFFNHSNHKEDLKGRLHNGFEGRPDAQLLEALEPVLQEIRLARAEEMKARITEAIGHHKAGEGIGNVWALAREGRVDHLIVERGYHCPAYIHNQQLFLDEPDSEIVVQVEDAVDDLIETVLQYQGDVFFLPPGTFDAKVAALLRY